MTAAATRRITDDRDDDFMPSAPQSGGTMDIATTRSAQEVQAAMVIAKRFPRDVSRAYSQIMESCKRRLLADNALYAYPRGDQTVTGPSIRLAEMLAQTWGNLDFGIIELEQKGGESQVMAYCWDLETNTRQTKIFTVKHERHTRNGVKRLTDPRDIYEMSANQGARRLRACILGVIPGDIVESAVAQCERTMQGSGGEPIADRIRKMIELFAEQGVTQEMIEKRVGHKADATTEPELVQLKKVYRSLRDGMTAIDAWFETGAAKPQPSAKKESGLNEALNERPAADADAAEPAATSPPTTEQSPVDRLVARLVARADCKPDKAHAALDRAFQAAEINPATLTPDQEADYASRIDAGAFDRKV